MLKEIKFIKEYRKIFKVNDTIVFRPGVNLLVGDQGSGKSSLIGVIRNKTLAKDHLTPVKEAVDFFALDFEKESPRAKQYVESVIDVHCRFVSHGETHLAILEALAKEDKFKNTTIIVDEPDMALSIRSCYKLVDIFKQCEKRDAQVIAAVHNPIIISSFKEVFNLETKKWTTSQKFISSQTIELNCDSGK